MAEATLGNLVYFIRAQNQQFKQTIRETEDYLKGVGATFNKGGKQAKDYGNSVTKGLDNARKSIQQHKEAIQSMAIGSAAALATMAMQIRRSIKETIDMQNSLAGLSSAAKAFHHDVGAVNQAAKDLSADGLMTLADAATGLKNLMMSGFGLQESINLMERFKDIAAFNRQGALGFGEAIRGATEGIKNQNSILVDNIGLTKNLTMILKEAGYSEQDLMKVTTDAGVRQALYNGLLKEASHFTGDAAKMTKLLSGRMAQTSVNVQKLYWALESTIDKPLTEFLETVNEILAKMTEWISLNKDLVGSLTLITTGTAGAIVVISTAILAIDKVIGIVKTAAVIASGSLSGLLSPIGLVIAGIAALTAAVIGVASAVKRAKEEKEKFVKTTMDMADKYGREAVELNSLLKMYDELLPKAKNSKEAHEELNAVVKRIGEIVPDAKTQWNELGEAIEINAEKARLTAREMLETRKTLLEVAKARAEFQIPQLEATVRRYEARVQKGQRELDEARKEQLAIYKKRAEALKFQERVKRIKSSEDEEKLYEEAVKAGFIEGGGTDRLLTEIDWWVNKAPKHIEMYIDYITKRMEKVSKKYFDAKYQLAEIAANEAELRKILEEIEKGNLTAGIKTDEETSTVTTTPAITYQDAKRKYEAEVEANRWSLEEQLRYWKERVGIVKKNVNEEDDYKKRLAKLENELTDAITKEQDKLALAREKGYNEELLALQQKHKKELNEVEENSERYKLIKERHQIELDNLTKKWDAETQAQQWELEAALLELKGDFENADILREKARFKREYDETKLSKDQLKTLEQEHQQKLLEITNEYAGKRAEVALSLKEAEIDSQISELEGQKEILFLHWNQNTARREALQIEREILNLQIKKIDLEIAELERQKKIAEEKNNQLEADKIAAEIAGLKTERDKLKRERDYNEKRYIADLSNDLKSNFSSAVKDGLIDGGKRGIDSLVDYLQQKARQRIADIITEAFFNSQIGKNMESWFTSAFGGSDQGGLFGFLGGLFGGGSKPPSSQIPDNVPIDRSKLPQQGGGFLGELGNIFNSALSFLGPFALLGSLFGDLFGGGPKELTIQASTANMEIDFATANFKEVTLPSSYMGRGVPSSNAVAPVQNIYVNVNAAGSLIAERDLNKRIESAVQTGIEKVNIKAKKWQSVTTKEG